MEHKIHIVVAVLGGCVDDIVATTDDAIAEALFKEFCAEYKFDPEHAESCANDVGTITVTVTIDDPATPTAKPVEVFELDE